MSHSRSLKVLVLEDTYYDLQATERILHEALRSEPHDIKSVQIVQEGLVLCEQWAPDLIVADGEIYNDKKAGAEFVREARRLLPEAKIMGLTRWPECYQPLKHAGCDHVINKSVFDSPASVEKHLRAALLSRPRLRVAKYPPSVPAEPDRVLRRMARGLTELQIADELCITQRQVKYHKQTLYDKFGTSKDNELIALAYKTGYLSPDDDLSDED